MQTKYTFSLKIKGPKYKNQIEGYLNAEDDEEIGQFVESFTEFLKTRRSLRPVKAPPPGMVRVEK